MNCYDAFLKNIGWIKEKNKKGLPSGFIGLEIETECDSHRMYDHLIEFSDDYPEGCIDGEFIETEFFKKEYGEYWRMVEDGSLRDFGVEWIFKKPLNVIQAKTAINLFTEATGSIKFNQDAPGTSVHVHLSVLDMTPIQLANFLTLLFMFENLLVEYCGPKRKSNLFALPSRVVQGNLATLDAILQKIKNGHQEPVMFLNEDSVKYAAINLCSLKSLGTVEVRCHPGCTDPDRLKLWIDLLVSIRNHSMLGTPKGMLDSWEESPEDLMHDVFGGNVGHLLFPNYQHLVDRNIMNLHNTLYGIDWGTFGMEYSVPKVKEEMYMIGKTASFVFTDQILPSLSLPATYGEEHV